MKIGFIGLGRMGQLIVEKLIKSNIEVVIYNRSLQKTKELIAKLENKNLTSAFTPSELANSLQVPRVIWLMVSYNAVGEVLLKLTPHLSKGDIIVDAGNSYYKDSIKRYKWLKKIGVHFLDVGTSGGLEGAINGFCFMVGGEEEIYNKMQPILNLLSKPNGSLDYFGPTGAGHFVKMVHNGVEYGMLEAIGEGFEILAGSREYVINLARVAKTWGKGSIVRGYLMDLTKRIFEKESRLGSIEGVVGGGSTGEWSVKTAQELGLKIPVIEASLSQRVKSRKKPEFSGKVIAALRHEFGGHEVVAKRK